MENVTLNPNQKLVINQILNSNLLLTKQEAEAINNVTLTEGVGVGTLGAVRALTPLAAKSGSFATSVIWMSTVIGGVIVLSGVTYGAFEVWRSHKNKKIREEDLRIYIDDIEGTIWRLYFKDEYINMRDCKNFKEYFTMDRNHEGIESYVKYLTESIIEPEQLNDKDLKDKLQKYKDNLDTYIKPEKIFDFHNKLRISCAYHKLGEFIEKDASYHSVNWRTRENLKGRIFDCFKDELKYKKNSNGQFKIDRSGNRIQTSDSFKLRKFEEIKDKYYRIFKVIEYLKTENFRKEEYIAFTEKILQSIERIVHPDRIRDFELFFRKYRYLGGECEFDRENVLNSRYYNQMYSYGLKTWNDCRNGSFVGNIAGRTIDIATATFAAECILMSAGIYINDILNDILKAGFACQNGDQNACMVLRNFIPQSDLNSEMERWMY